MISLLQDLIVTFYSWRQKVELVPLYVRITPELHSWLQNAARKDRRSMASLTELLLREGMRRREPGSLSNDYPLAEKTLSDINVSDAVDRMLADV